MSGPRRIFEFDGFRADLGNHQLFRGQTPILLTPKAFDTLAVLLERHGQVVDKEELLNLVWPGTFVEEATLTQNIYTLRKVLAEAGGRGNYIETLPRRGYRFGVPVEEVPTEPATTKPMPVVVLPTTEEEETALPNAETASLSPLAPLASRRRPQYLFAVVGLVVGALLLAMLIVRRSGSPEPEAARPGIRSVAVLPFEPLTPAANEAGQSEDAVLGLGMADALITRLSNLRQLSVRPTSAVRRYTGANRNLGAIARELNVDAVLDGSFQRAQQRLRVSVQLIAGETSAPLWAASYDAVETSLFDLQDSISQRLTEELRLEFTRQEWARLSQHRTSSPAAYQSYLKGRFFWNRRTAESLERAIGFFQEAIGLDPSFAAAYAGLADCYVLQPFVGNEPPQKVLPQALAAAQKALALDDSLAEAHTSLAYARFVFDRNYDAAEQGFRRAIELNPGYPTAHQWYAFLLAARERATEAEAEARRAVSLDPTSLVINTDLGMVLTFARRSDAAIEQFRRALELDPSFAYAHFGLGHAYQQQGKLDLAVAEFRRAAELAGGTTVTRAALGQALATAGQRVEARSILAGLEARAGSEYVDPSQLAFLWIGLGEKKQALEHLRAAAAERSRFVAFLATWSIFDPLRQEPGWAELLREAQLGP